jgi:hypothetical protein
MDYSDEHSNFDRMTCICDHTEVDCFFSEYCGSLHFAYIGGQLVTEMLRDAVIQNFERQYELACRLELEESKLSAALDRYHAKQDYA